MKSISIVICIGFLTFCYLHPGIVHPAGNDNLSSTTQSDPAEGLSGVDQMTDVHDIKPLEKLDFGSALAVYILVAVAALVICVLLIYLMRRRTKKGPDPAVAAVFPDETALLLLDKLENGKGLDQKAFYFALSSILRNYVKGRFAVDAPEMTTEELIPRLKELALDPKRRAVIKTFLLYADPVKFANFPASQGKMKTDLGIIRDFVKHTAESEAPGT